MTLIDRSDSFVFGFSKLDAMFGRAGRLKADLAATPAERLRDAEEILQMARMVRPARNRAQVIAFDSYEDYYRWKTIHRAGA